MDSTQTVEAIRGALRRPSLLADAGLMSAVLSRLSMPGEMTTIAELARKLGKPSPLVAHAVAQLLQVRLLERSAGYDEVRLSGFGRELILAMGNLSNGR